MILTLFKRLALLDTIMPIRNKDGTLYTLRGVNPLMKDQEHGDGWKVHYVETDPVVIDDPKMAIPDYVPEDAPVAAIVGVGVIADTEVLYCLPLITRIEEDVLYGQKKKIASWGEKFTFEAVKVNYSGLTVTFYAKLPSEVSDRLTMGSILYVYKGREWWKINNTELSGEGIAIHCMPSDVKPSFI